MNNEEKLALVNKNIQEIGIKIGEDYSKSFTVGDSDWQGHSEAIMAGLKEANLELDWDELSEEDLEDDYMDLEANLIEWAKNGHYLLKIKELQNTIAETPSITSQVLSVHDLADKKSVCLDLSPHLLALDMPDGTYTMFHTSWRYEGDEMSSVFTKTYEGLIVKDGYVDIVSALTILSPLFGENFSDPHIYFEGFSIENDEIHINFGS